MSPLQSFRPNKVFFNRFHLDRNRFHQHPKFIYASDGESELILPVILDNKLKRITEFAPLDYYDAILSGQSELLKSILVWMKSQFSGYRLTFSRLNPTSSLFQLFETSCTISEKCVHIPLQCQSFDAYFASLSKHQRQNIRTAYNRLAREGITPSLTKYKNGKSFPKKVKKVCQDIYTGRYALKNSSRPMIKQLYHRLSLPVFKIMLEIENGALFVLHYNDNPVAFMAGAYTKDRRSFVVPMFFASNDFLRYSPGIILLAEVTKYLISENVSILDLARGDEFYKYAMGGVDHFTYSISITQD